MRNEILKLLETDSRLTVKYVLFDSLHRVDIHRRDDRRG